ncbi:MAG: response regulator transcription factor [Rhizobiaceae bacterium]
MLKSVLLVDDDEPYLRVFGRALQQAGFEVSTATSIEDAKQVLEISKPKCAIVDLHLNAESGFNFIEYLRSERPDMRIVLLSGYITPTMAARATRMGAVDCLQKPTDVETLKTVLLKTDDDGQAPSSQATMEASQIRLQHVLLHWEKNNRNSTKTAIALNMHRRTLQRILTRAGIERLDENVFEEPSRFTKLRRLYNVWRRFGASDQRQSR